MEKGIIIELICLEYQLPRNFVKVKATPLIYNLNMNPILNLMTLTNHGSLKGSANNGLFAMGIVSL